MVGNRSAGMASIWSVSQTSDLYVDKPFHQLSCQKQGDHSERKRMMSEGWRRDTLSLQRVPRSQLTFPPRAEVLQLKK